MTDLRNLRWYQSGAPDQRIFSYTDFVEPSNVDLTLEVKSSTNIDLSNRQIKRVDGRNVINHVDEFRVDASPNSTGQLRSAVIRPKRGQNVFTDTGAQQRAPRVPNVGRTKGINLTGRLNLALDLGYLALTAIQYVMPPPCPYVTDEEFYTDLETNKAEAYNRIATAETIDAVDRAAGTMCFLNIGTMVVASLVPGGQAALPFLATAQPYTCGTALLTASGNFVADHVMRNNQIHQARTNAALTFEEEELIDPCTVRDAQTLTAREAGGGCCKPDVIYYAYRFIEEIDEEETKIRVKILVNVRSESGDRITGLVSRWKDGTFLHDWQPSGELSFHVGEFVIPEEEIDLGEVNYFTLEVQTENTQTFGFYQLNPEVDAIATVPEHWQVRPGAHVPQLVIQYAIKREDQSRRFRMQIVIPHFVGERDWIPPRYRKGSWQGRHILKDNSRVLIYAVDQDEALRVVNIFAAQQDPEFIQEERYTGRIRGQGFAEADVTPVRADFYPTGQRNLVPEWRAYYPLPPDW